MVKKAEDLYFNRFLQYSIDKLNHYKPKENKMKLGDSDPVKLPTNPPEAKFIDAKITIGTTQGTIEQSFDNYEDLQGFVEDLPYDL